MTTSDEDAFQRLETRSKVRDSHREEEERIAAVVRRETDKRIVGWLWVIALIGLGWWIGWVGVAVCVGAFVAITMYEKWVEDRTPGAVSDTAELLAEDYIRLQIIAELHKRGELKWKLEEGKVSAAEHKEWDTFWERLEKVLPEFEALSPMNRQKRLIKAKAQSLSARKELLAFATQHNADPIWWARIEPAEDVS